MLYEKKAYEDFILTSKSTELDIVVKDYETDLEAKAKALGVSITEFKRQIKLHSPQFPQEDYCKPHFLTKSIYPILTDLLKGYPNEFEKYRLISGANLFDNKKLKIKYDKENSNNALIIEDRKRNGNNSNVNIKLCVKEVQESTGQYIEEKLHYLRSFRNDAIFRVGLFIVGYKNPICYMSFSNIDREDKIIALKKSMNQQISKDEVIELSRVYGCGNLPMNTISFLISKTVIFLKNYNYLITAVNTNLGFSGMSMLASGFVPFAFRPVNYFYDYNGFYTTKRKNIICKKSPNPMIQNILYVKNIKSIRNFSNIYCKLIDINTDKYSIVKFAIEHEVFEMRTILEKLWDDNTRYHRTTNTDINHLSKGQCGVSSLLLGRKLKNKGYSVMFCTGNMIFRDKSLSISNHCWIVLKRYGNQKSDIIIDLTADQNGYSKKIIFNTKDDLEKLNIVYELTSEIDPYEINNQHLLKRLEYLEEKLSCRTYD